MNGISKPHLVGGGSTRRVPATVLASAVGLFFIPGLAASPAEVSEVVRAEIDQLDTGTPSASGADYRLVNIEHAGKSVLVSVSVGRHLLLGGYVSDERLFYLPAFGRGSQPTCRRYPLIEDGAATCL